MKENKIDYMDRCLEKYEYFVFVFLGNGNFHFLSFNEQPNEESITESLSILSDKYEHLKNIDADSIECRVLTKEQFRETRKKMKDLNLSFDKIEL